MGKERISIALCGVSEAVILALSRRDEVSLMPFAGQEHLEGLLEAIKNLLYPGTVACGEI